jgi:hypothetical protein
MILQGRTDVSTVTSPAGSAARKRRGSLAIGLSWIHIVATLIYCICNLSCGMVYRISVSVSAMQPVCPSRVIEINPQARASPGHQPSVVQLPRICSYLPRLLAWAGAAIATHRKELAPAVGRPFLEIGVYCEAVGCYPIWIIVCLCHFDIFHPLKRRKVWLPWPFSEGTGGVLIRGVARLGEGEWARICRSYHRDGSCVANQLSNPCTEYPYTVVSFRILRSCWLGRLEVLGRGRDW